ncbi:MAG: tRNA (adenosine(37)-N6)-threonylcarbamoyltransferase complex dimerization subunit type 1 TsaB [Clostridia bacterium]|nr:tRNA (adenosine(37)-N6)-threonylcarbamoyltransferase complex dimerization subunit type 1 TsaB [Clostridia bacterium]
MKVLALDSTAKSGSAAVLDGERALAVFTTDSGNTHSESLLPMAEAVMEKSRVPLDAIDLFAVTAGPGSFTGVRIGVSVVKGLAFGREKPCVGVSTLEALAEGLSPLGGLLCPVMDARRNQVYNALFRVSGGVLIRLCPDRAISLEELTRELREKYPFDTVRLAGDGCALTRTALDAAGIPVAETPPMLRNLSADAVGRCALRAHARGESTTDSALAPTYLRLPQAERERLEKQNNKS